MVEVSGLSTSQGSIKDVTDYGGITSRLPVAHVLVITNQNPAFLVTTPSDFTKLKEGMVVQITNPDRIQGSANVRDQRFLLGAPVASEYKFNIGVDFSAFDHAFTGGFAEIVSYVPPRPNDPLPGEEPSLNSINPSSARIGSADITMNVNGNKFTPTSVIYFNGGPELTTFNSPSQVSTVVKPSLAIIPISVPVWVQQGEYQTDAKTFTFTDPQVDQQ
jgi:hypothetical protein